jgi:hypothetical protein
MFLRLDVSTEESFKIGGIPLRVRMFGKTKLQTTKTVVGLYQINESMLEWSNRIGRSLQTLQGLHTVIPKGEILKLYSSNREWVNDDSGLIAQCLIDTSGTTFNGSVFLISQDKRLANQMTTTCNVIVHLVDTVSIVECFPNRDWNANSVLTLVELTNRIDKNYFFYLPPMAVYIDTGSLAHVASRYQRQVRGVWDRAIYRRTLLQTSYLKNGNRREVVELEQIPFTQLLTVKPYRPTVNRQKGYKVSSTGSSSADSSENWRIRRPLPDQNAVRSESFSSNQDVDWD